MTDSTPVTEGARWRRPSGGLVDDYPRFDPRGRVALVTASLITGHTVPIDGGWTSR